MGILITHRGRSRHQAIERVQQRDFLRALESSRWQIGRNDNQYRYENVRPSGLRGAVNPHIPGHPRFAILFPKMIGWWEEPLAPKPSK